MPEFNEKQMANLYHNTYVAIRTYINVLKPIEAKLESIGVTTPRWAAAGVVNALEKSLQPLLNAKHRIEMGRVDAAIADTEKVRKLYRSAVNDSKVMHRSSVAAMKEVDSPSDKRILESAVKEAKQYHYSLTRHVVHMARFIRELKRAKQQQDASVDVPLRKEALIATKRYGKKLLLLERDCHVIGNDLGRILPNLPAGSSSISEIRRAIKLVKAAASRVYDTNVALNREARGR